MAGDFDFSNRSALITGAASGIGAATAHWLDAHGIARLVLMDLDAEGLSRLDLTCEVERMAGDVSDPALWTGFADRPAFDHVIANAGIGAASPIAGGDFAQWRRVMAINLDGAFLTLAATLGAMQRAGKGSVVVTASAAALKAEPTTAAYAASKAALVQLAKVAAKESAVSGVRVNAIAPGGVDTPIWDSMDFFADMTREAGSRDAAIQAMGRMATPLGRYASAGEIAGQIGFLLSDMAATITGAVLSSDGGYTL